MGHVKRSFEVELFRIADLKKLFAEQGLPAALNPLGDEGYFFPTSSGKAALCLALADLCQTGHVTSAQQHILVPRWLGSWVYMVMHPYIFPSTVFTAQTRAILVYHQYGFPQNLAPILAFARQHDLAVIEDCAHALKGRWDNKPLGGNGDYSLFSFSKFYPCLMGGGLWVRRQDAAERISARLASLDNGFLQGFSLLARALYDLSSRKSALSLQAIECSYATYEEHPRMSWLTAQLLATDLAARRLEQRRTHWSRLRDTLAGHGLVDDLEEEAYPYMVPVKIPVEKGEGAKAALAEQRIDAGYYQFDRARNLLAPEFEPRLCVPLHQGLSSETVAAMATILRNVAA